MKTPKAFQLYLDYAENFEYLTDEEVGKLIRALLHYANTGEIQDMDRVLMQAFIPIKKQMDADFEKYEQKCKKNAENVSKRYEETEDNSTNVYERRKNLRTYTNATNTNTKKNINLKEEKDKEKKTPFSKPSPSDISLYCTEKGYKINVDRFYDYYESNGWMVGRNRMKDWKAAVRSWASRERGSPQKKKYGDYLQRDPVHDTSFGLEYVNEKE